MNAKSWRDRVFYESEDSVKLAIIYEMLKVKEEREGLPCTWPEPKAEAV